MYIDRILSPIETLGPGRRLVIWTKGCTKRCKGCANPELWTTHNAKNYPVDDIVKIIGNIYKNDSFDGITISGGDPLEQIEDLCKLIIQIKQYTSDIMVYTGYDWDCIHKHIDVNCINILKENVSVLIDKPYIEELNCKEAVLRGSSNQSIIFFNETYRNVYEDYLKQGRKIQNVYMGSKLISVGIHDRRRETESE